MHVASGIKLFQFDASIIKVLKTIMTTVAYNVFISNNYMSLYFIRASSIAISYLFIFRLAALFVATRLFDVMIKIVVATRLLRFLLQLGSL